MSLDIDHIYANVASAGAIGLAWAGHLPTIAAVIGGAWYAIQIYESKTVQSWTVTKRAKALWTWIVDRRVN